jgi:serine/threonine protein phosphatase PrpC
MDTTALMDPLESVREEAPPPLWEPLVHRVCGGSAAFYSAPAPSRVDANEDSAALLPLNESCGLLAVADGLGGQRSGDVASQLAIDSLRDALAALPAQESDAARTPLEGAAADSTEPGALPPPGNAGAPGLLRSAVLDGIEAANQRILFTGVGAASTIAVVEVNGRSVRPYHVGDSMILVVGQRGKIKLQTVCHSPVGFAVEAGLIDEQEAMHHAERHVVSNVVGSNSMRIEIGPMLRLAPRDTLLIASDGLFDNLHVPEIVALIRNGPLNQALAALVTEARRRMTAPREGEPSKPDDLSVILYRPSLARN